MTDSETAEAIDQAVDGYQMEVILGLVDIGLSQSSGSVGAAGAVVEAPSRLATPMFKPGTPHKLQPTQIPRVAVSAHPGLGSNVAAALSTLAIQALLEAIGRTTDVEEEEREKMDLCKAMALDVILLMKNQLTQLSQREAIFTQDKVKRWRRKRKSNKN